MGQLGGLVSTPRAAKRMVNIYRLARIGGTAAALKSPVTEQSSSANSVVWRRGFLDAVPPRTHRNHRLTCGYVMGRP